MPPNTKYVGRGSKWGNPYKVGEYTLEESLRLHKAHLAESITTGTLDIKELLGYDNLACFCPLNSPCHADTLIKVLEAYKATQAL